MAVSYSKGIKISIHALLAESDGKLTFTKTVALISIHALLAESDLIAHDSRKELLDFYPRSPCGERLMLESNAPTPTVFLSTLSLRRATVWIPLDDGSLFISIHALLAESDLDTWVAFAET